MQRILLTGASGQIGQALRRQLTPWLSAADQLYCPTRAEFDLSHPRQMQTWLDRYQPTLIINAAAYTAVDQAEQERTLANQINHLAVQQLADWAALNHARLLHYSTDYVFDGNRPLDTAYLETDPTAPLNVYGQTKQAGEQAILQAGCRAWILRTSWVYADQGRNFINTILQLAQQRESLSIVSDQIGAPNHAERIADYTLSILTECAVDLPTGIYHLSASGQTSWYGLAQYVLQIAERAESLRCGVAGLKAITSADYPTAAQRPHNSQLCTQNIQQYIQLDLPHWSVDVEQMLKRRYERSN
jgi:dTDP-4-dehydrorhamnose reductase